MSKKAKEEKKAKTQLEVETEVKAAKEKVKAADQVLAPVAKPKKLDISDIEVEDPQILRPKELPLVIKPKSGSWKNDQQAEYAGYLNAYAYSNPEKWATKKAHLLQKLAEIGENGNAINRYKGVIAGVSYVNKLMST